MRKYFLIIVICWGEIVVVAQVPVKNEPRHHNVFENEYVRVLDVWVAPGDTTQFHVHATPSVFNMFTNTITGSQLLGQQPSKSGKSKAGSASYDNLVIPRIHRVWNEDTSWYHVMDIELIGGKPRTAEPIVQNAALQLLFDEQLVRGYHVQIAARGNLQLPPSKNGYLLLSLGSAAVTCSTGHAIQRRNLMASHYIWISAGEGLSITDVDGEASAFTLLQLK